MRRSPLLGGVLPLFGSTIFLGALLVFGVQPIAARLLLPWFGGSPAVWSAVALFFQSALLAGYGYSYLLTRRLSPRRQPLLHAVALLAPLVFLPIGVPIATAPPGDVSPVLSVIALLAIGLGLPFTVASTTGPLLQRWFSLSGHSAGRDPYFLYAASNAGSLLVLLAYPFVIEPNLPLSAQSAVWSLGYLLFAAAAMACGLVVWRRASTVSTPTAAEIAQTSLAWRTRGRWVLLAALPSALMLAVTNYISTDIAAVPLLWILPLALYLASFIVAFSAPRNRWLQMARLSSRGAGMLLLPLTVVLLLDLAGLLHLDVAASIGLQLALLFVAAVMCHGRLADERPEPARLTEFYLLMSVGGALGGVFVSLLAPIAFDRVWEYPLAIVGVLALRPALRLPRALQLVGHRLVTAAVAGVVLVAVTLGAGNTIYTDRTFFGVYRVVQSPSYRQLVHGTTGHGTQLTNQPQLATSYYHPSGPIGQVFAQRAGLRDNVGLVGLGIGSLAAYGEPGDHFTFFEIDPGMVYIARDSGLFSFLADSAADVDIEVADGRLGLQASEQRFDLLVLDAFSSDAVPVHLMTVEAFTAYLQRLAPGGLIAMHISNRNLDLEPVLAATLEQLGLPALIQVDTDVSSAQAAEGKAASAWVIMAPDPRSLNDYRADARWRLLQGDPQVAAWSDERSDILSALR